MNNNKTLLAGTVVDNFTYSHISNGEQFYSGLVSVQRMSGVKDIIPIIISEVFIDIDANYKGKFFSVEGEYRSRNVHADGKTKLDLYVFVTNVNETDVDVDLNSVSLQGFVCKEPVYRKTPKGRQICDLLIAVNGNCSKSQYIPCVVWGRNAYKSSGFMVGDKVEICGRIQSREYQKKIGEDEYETRVAYEVSVSKVNLLKEEDDE